jgi:transcriptional regulator with XRE-family HTH domain
MNLKVKNLTGQKIRLYRKQQGWTQNMLAASLQKTGVPITRHIIANIETRCCSVTDCQLAFIAKALRIPLLLFFSNDANPADFNSAFRINPLCEHPFHARRQKRFMQNPLIHITHIIGEFAKRLMARREKGLHGLLLGTNEDRETHAGGPQKTRAR